MVSMQQKASPFSQNTCVQLHNKTFEPCVVGRGCDNLTLKIISANHFWRSLGSFAAEYSRYFGSSAG